MKNPSPEIVCEQCGDVGFHQLLVICSRCIATQRHMYCMNNTPHYTEKWYCNDCLAETIRINRKAIRSNDKRIETPIKEIFWQKSIKELPRRPAKKMMLGSIYSRTLKAESLNNTETNEDTRNDDAPCGRVNVHLGDQGLVAQDIEVNKQGSIFSTRDSSSTPSSPGKITQSVPQGSAARTTTTCEALKKGKGNRTSAYARKRRKNMDLPSQLIVVLDEEHQSQPSPRSLWKGGFEVLDGAPQKFYEVRGHLPGKLHLTAFQAVEKLPKKIKFKLLPRRNVWPKVFQVDRPTDQDVGLFFFPSDGGRSKENYVKLLERIDKDDLAMQSSLGNLDLVVYTSSQLPKDSEVAATMGPFFWGLVWKVKNKGLSNSNGPAGEREVVIREAAAILRDKSEVTPTTPPSAEKMVNRRANLEVGANSLHQASPSPPAGPSANRPNIRETSNKSNGLESPQSVPCLTKQRFTAFQHLSSPRRVQLLGPEFQEDKVAFASFSTGLHQLSISFTPRRRRSLKRRNVRETHDKSNDLRSTQAAQRFIGSQPFSSPGRVQPSSPVMDKLKATSPVIVPSLNKPSTEPNVSRTGDTHGVKEEFPSVPPGFQQLPTRPHQNASESSNEANGRRSSQAASVFNSSQPFSIPGSELAAGIEMQVVKEDSRSVPPGSPQPSDDSNMQISPQTTPRFDSPQPSFYSAFYSAPSPNTCEQFAQSSQLQYSDAFLNYARQLVALYGRKPGSGSDGAGWHDQVRRYRQDPDADASSGSYPCWPPNYR